MCQCQKGIAIRHILESHNPEKRCGRPSKNPVRIPIPKSINVLDLRSLMELSKKYTYDPQKIYGDTPIETASDIAQEMEVANHDMTDDSSSDVRIDIVYFTFCTFAPLNNWYFTTSS